MIPAAQHDAVVYAEVARTARGAARELIAPQAEAMDEAEMMPDDLLPRLAGLGLLGIAVPERMGGAGLDVLSYAIVMEALSGGAPAVADQVGLIELVATLFAQHGTEAQRAGHLPGILSGSTCVAYCLTEEGAGSDLAALRSTAMPQDGGGWRLDGTKMWINNAPTATLGLVLARMAPLDARARHRGMGIFVVDLTAPGVLRGRKERKMGQRACPVGTLAFDGVVLPPDALLGAPDRGFQTMMSVLEKGRVGIAALATGIAQAALERATAHARDRRQGGGPIIDHQGLGWLLADMATEVAAARALVREAALRLDAGLPAGMAASMAKRYASDVAVARTADAVQVLGGSGYMRGTVVERLYRDAKITQIYEGTNQIQRDIIVRHLKAGGERVDA